MQRHHCKISKQNDNRQGKLREGNETIMRGEGRVEKGGNLRDMREWFLKVLFQGGFDTVFTQSNVKFDSSLPVILTIVASSLRLQ